MLSRRKLAAILSADVAGYSRLMADDDRATVETIQAYRQIIREWVERHGGRVVDSPGDALLAEFPSAIEALDCAQQIQQVLEKRNAQLAEHRRMQFRMGINLGDVIEDDGALYGDGVNIAARLEQLANPGGVCVSGTVFDQVEGKLPYRFEFIGEQQVKNIPRPVRVYRLTGEEQRVVSMATGRNSHSRRRMAVIVIAIMTLGAAVAGGWYAARSRQMADAALALPTGPSIAVLPFANLSGDPKQDYFADGIAEQIITELTRFRNLFVIARNSTFQYKGKAVDVRQVGKDLGARYVVEGSVQRGDDILRVTVQLLDARTGTHLWAETFERDLKQAKVFGVQDDTTERVVGAIADDHGAISHATFEESKSKGTNSLDAYECVLRYYAYRRNLSSQMHLHVRECLEQAVKLSPSYAEAWAALADIYCQEHSASFNPGPDPLKRALGAAQHAVELDSASPLAHLALSMVYFFASIEI